MAWGGDQSNSHRKGQDLAGWHRLQEAGGANGWCASWDATDWEIANQDTDDSANEAEPKI